jgi:hypothetical protein
MDLPIGILTLQRTDRWVGEPLCAILTLLRKICESAGRPGPRQFRRILFKFAEQGSTVLAYPAIRRAIEMVGRENVYFVVFEDNRFILDAMEIIPDGLTGFRMGSEFGNLSRRRATPCLSLHHNVSAHRQHFRRSPFLMLTRAAESFRAHGITSSRILPNIRLHISSTFTLDLVRNIECNNFQF